MVPHTVSHIRGTGTPNLPRGSWAGNLGVTPSYGRCHTRPQTAAANRERWISVPWPWRRRDDTDWSAPNRVPDGDTVLFAGHQRWADLLEQSTRRVPAQRKPLSPGGPSPGGR